MIYQVNNKDIDKDGKTLHSWWTGGTAEKNAGSPDKWAENYDSEDQEAIRKALNIQGREE